MSHFENFYILLSSTYNPIYLSFIPSVSYMWKQYGFKVILGLITNKTKEDALIKEIEKHVDELYLEKYNNKGSIVANGKLLRLYLTKYHENDNCIIMDIDYYVLNLDYYNLLKMKKNALNDKLYTYGYNIYKNLKHNKYKDSLRFPMYNLSSKGKNIMKIFNITSNSSFDEFLKNCSSGKKLFMNDDIKKNNFSDESLILQLISIKNMSKFFVHLPRKCNSFNQFFTKRIDRTYNVNLFFNNNLLQNHLDKTDIIDVTPIRPFDDKKLFPILKKLKIPKEKFFLKNMIDEKKIGIYGTLDNNITDNFINQLIKKNQYFVIYDYRKHIGNVSDLSSCDEIYYFIPILSHQKQFLNPKIFINKIK